MSRDVRIGLGLFVFTLLMFGRLLFCDFTWWDDPQTIHHNPLLNPPTWAAVGHYWTAVGPRSPMGLYVPVTYTVWCALAWVAQMPATPDGIRLNPMVFHGFNVILHATSTTLVFAILRKLLTSTPGAPGGGRNKESLDLHESDGVRSPSHRESGQSGVFPALAGALLFAIHPVQAETIAWTSGTKDLLCGLFTLVAIERYLCFARRSRSLDLVVTFVAVLLAMLSKPTAVVAPLLLLAIGSFTLRRSPRQPITELWQMLALMIPCSAIARWSQPATFTSPVPILARPLVAADAIGFYAQKLLWPMHLSPDYGRSPAYLLQEKLLFRSGVAWLVIEAAVLIACWRLWPRRLTLAIVLFVIPLLPVLGLQPFLYQYHSTVTDHYLYLPMLGAAALLMMLCERHRGRVTRLIVPLMLVLLGVRTLLREPAWQNTRTLFADAVADGYETFGNFDMLGFTYAHEATQLARAGDTEAARRAATLAINHYAEAIQLNPLDVPARDNLARIESNLGDHAAAVQQVKAIIELQPQLPADLRADPADLQKRLREYGGDH